MRAVAELAPPPGRAGADRPAASPPEPTPAPPVPASRELVAILAALTLAPN